jgi:hypothetical protein
VFCPTSVALRASRVEHKRPEHTKIKAAAAVRKERRRGEDRRHQFDVDLVKSIYIDNPKKINNRYYSK